jgi:hypothetical protein
MLPRQQFGTFDAAEWVSSTPSSGGASPIVNYRRNAISMPDTFFRSTVSCRCIQLARALAFRNLVLDRRRSSTQDRPDVRRAFQLAGDDGPLRPFAHTHICMRLIEGADIYALAK